MSGRYGQHERHEQNEISGILRIIVKSGGKVLTQAERRAKRIC